MSTNTQKLARSVTKALKASGTPLPYSKVLTMVHEASTTPTVKGPKEEMAVKPLPSPEALFIVDWLYVEPESSVGKLVDAYPGEAMKLLGKLRELVDSGVVDEDEESDCSLVARKVRLGRESVIAPVAIRAVENGVAEWKASAAELFGEYSAEKLNRLLFDDKRKMESELNSLQVCFTGTGTQKVYFNTSDVWYPEDSLYEYEVDTSLCSDVSVYDKEEAETVYMGYLPVEIFTEWGRVWAVGIPTTSGMVYDVVPDHVVYE